MAIPAGLLLFDQSAVLVITKGVSSLSARNSSDCGTVIPASLRSDLRELDHLRPPLGLLNRAAQVLEPPLDLRISEGGIDLAVEQIDDFAGGVGRRANSRPAAPHIAGHRLTDRRDIRQNRRARRGRDRKRTNPASPDVLDR